MSRSIFVSSCGDPFILLLAHKLFKERWYDEADRMFIGVNNHSGVPKEVVSEALARLSLDPKVHIIYHPTGIGNGRPITEMTLIARDELVMLLEDDGFIFTPGVVDKCFQKIESDLCDAIGSPRGSCGMEIWEAAKRKYNLDYTGYGDVGPNYWPNFFFCKRQDLLNTDMNFGSKTWVAGEYSKELDHTFTEVNHADTFGWGVIQMRYNGIRFDTVPQFHASPNEAADKRLKVMNWIGEKPYWIHGGSLSSGWGGYLSQSVPPTETDQEKFEMESRCAFWTIASDIIEGFESFKPRYKQGITDLITNAHLEYGRVQEKIALYRELMNL